MTESPEGEVEFRILGPVEMQVDGRTHDLGSPKERCVLAMLLWRLGQPVPADSLVDGIWGENPPASARASLHSYVSRLRGALKGTAAQLRWRSGYYLLDADPASVDLYQFRTLREQARAIGDSGEERQAAVLLRRAEKLWNGEPLAGLNGGWADRIRVKLEEDRFRATCDRIKMELRLGHHENLVGEIYDLAAQHPFNQTLVVHLMVALYRCGRVTEALDAYQRTRRMLVEEAGSEPNAELRDLHQRVLNEDPDLVVVPSRNTLGPAANSLPRDNPDFTGRAAELRGLFGAIDTGLTQATATVVAVTGMPGVGKSTFAIHVAHLLGENYPERFYLHLHTHDHVAEPVDPAAGLSVLLRTLGVPSGEVPESVEDRATLWRTKLANRRALIVLDDASEPEQIRPMLPGSPGCLVLVTCRRRTIGLPGTSWIHLDPLRTDEAISLFVRIIGTERAADQAAVSKVVRLCGYLPLKIQLEGSRFRQQHPSWDVADLAAQLSRAVHDNRRRGRAEDREVANSLDLSYRYLTNQQQQLFRRLALHPGANFSVYAVAAAAGSDSLDTAERALDALLDHHLLEEPERGRYTFHDLIRGYAWQRTQIDDPEPERQRVIHRILDYYLCLAEQAAIAVYPFQHRISTKPTHPPRVLPPLVARSDCQSLMEIERDNLFGVIRYAAARGWPEHAALIPHALAKFLFAWGQWADAIELLHVAVRAWREIQGPRGEGRALTDLCFFLGRVGRYSEALECGHTALAIARSQSDQAAEASALDRIGLIYWQSSRYAEALVSHEEALRIWRATHNLHGEADALAHSAISFLRISQYEDALSRMGRALAIYREIGDELEEGRALNNIGDVQKDLGYYEEAFENYRQALTIFQEAGSRQEEAVSLNNVAGIYQLTGRYDESLKCYRESLEINRYIGDRRCEAEALNNIGEAFFRSGHYSEALVHHEKALAISHELTEPYQEVRSLCSMGNINLEKKKYAAAADDYRAALELSKHIGATYQEALAWDGLGSALLHTEGKAVAREHWQKALNLFQHIRMMREAEATRERLQTLYATIPNSQSSQAS